MALCARQAGCAYSALWLTLNWASSKTIQFTPPSREKTVSEKIWLNSYPAGMPAEIDVDQFSSIADLLHKCFAKFADKPALVKVVIVKKDPNLSKESVIEHCKRELTGYKIPKYVEFRDSLPKTPIGKILRRELRGK